MSSKGQTPVSQRGIDHRYAPPIQWTSICRPDDPHKTLVDQDGVLLYDYQAVQSDLERYSFRRRISFYAQAADNFRVIEQRTESARIPVVHTLLDYSRFSLQLISFAYQDDSNRRSDVVIWQLRAKAEAVVTAMRLDIQELEYQFIPEATGYSQTIRACTPQEAEYTGFFGLVDPQVHTESLKLSGSIVAVSQPEPLHRVSTRNFAPGSGLMTELLQLEPGVVAEGAFIFPLNHQQTEDFSLAWAKAALETERHFWQTLNLQSRKLRLADTAVNDMLVACARNILQARELEEGLPVFKVGPTVYRSLYFVDGHFFLEAAQYLGWTEAALNGIEVLLKRRKPDGSFSIIPHHLKETGIAIATIVRQHELIDDFQALRERLWPELKEALHYIEDLVDEAERQDTKGSVFAAMPMAYGDGGAGGRRYEYTTPLWTLIGLKFLSDRAEQICSADEAQHIAALYERLGARVRRQIANDLQSLPDGTAVLPMVHPSSGPHHWLPDYPAEVLPWHRINQATATWALAQAIYPGELFAADDPVVLNFCRLLDSLDDEQGLPVETGWLPYKALWPYAGMFYANAWLYAGYPDKALDYLYAFANHATPTRVWREEQSLASSGIGQFFGDMPHNWASVEFIRLLRNCLIFERGDVLDILPAVAETWLEPGQPLEISTATRFGDVTLQVAIEADRTAQIRLEHQPVKAVPLQAYRVFFPVHRQVDAWRLVLNNRVIDLPEGQADKFISIEVAQ